METLNSFLNAKIVWFLIGLMLIVLEFMAPGLVCLFFSLSAFIVMGILFIMPLSINAQLSLFLVISLLSLIVARKKCIILFGGHTTEKNPEGELDDEFKGNKVPVENEILQNRTGKVMFRGSLWEAESQDPVAKGEMVEIVGKRGIILKVKKI